MARNSRTFCVELSFPASEQARQAALRENPTNAEVSEDALTTGRLWEPGRTLRVRFLEGDAALQRRVQEYAEQWSEHAGIRFAFGDDPDAEIRVAFKPGDASWSTVGTDALLIPMNEPTMNFGWLTPESSDEDVRWAALHEFGHALGLTHQHPQRAVAIQWDEAAVIADLSSPPWNWDRETIRHNVLERYDPPAPSATLIDASSIMVPPIPAQWTLDGFSSAGNSIVSRSDKEYVRRLYRNSEDAGGKARTRAKADAETRRRRKDFVERYTTGDPSEGFTTEEAIAHLRDMGEEAPPEVLQRAVVETVHNLSADQRKAFATMLERRQAPQRWGGVGANHTLGGLLGRLLGGGMAQPQPRGANQLDSNAFDDLLGGMFGGGGSGPFGGRFRQQPQAQAGGVDEILSSPLGKVLLGGVAANAMKNMEEADEVLVTETFIDTSPEQDETAPMPAATAPRLSKVHERVVNTGFVPQATPTTPLAPTMPLGCDQSYFFWMEIGPLDPASIEETPVPLPIEHLPPEALLRVALFSFEDELQITPGSDVGELQLRKDGSVVVARQPAGSDAIQLPGDLLARRLFFPVRTPNRAGDYRLRCNIYHGQVLVQSRLVRARVMRRPHDVTRALRSRLDYTLSRSLAPAQLAAMQPHRLSLMLNDNGDGTHGFRFVGEQEFKSDASFDGDELQDHIDQTRGALRLAAWGEDKPWKDQAYRYDGPLDQDRLAKDLITFAIRGYRFYDAIINRLSGGAVEAESLAALMRESGLVQIASKESARLVLPAAMIYDYAFDTAADRALYTLCPDFLAAVTTSTSLEELPCFASSCPHATREDNETLICPSGFWGYRHAIGMPLSVATAPDAPSVIAAPGGPQVAIGVSTDANFIMRAKHEQDLQGLHPGLGWNYADTRSTTLELLKASRSHIVYFYCHGGVANNVPYIQVGPVTERGITRDTLRYKKIRWDEPRPLVFINGCHTTALEPEQALEFVSALVENTGASGVIGTEITLFEPVATQFAQHCLDRFLDGAPIGAAVRGARLALLQDGNPLGLIYLPFAMADLRLVDAPPVA